MCRRIGRRTARESPISLRRAWAIQERPTPWLSPTADGGNERIIYETTHIVGDIAWSPDGERLAASINLQIFTMRADGTPRWSPDGGRIAYVTPSSFPGFQQIFVMEADGSGKRRVANIHGDVHELLGVMRNR